VSKFIQTLLSWGPAGVFLLAIVDNCGVPMVGGVDALVVLMAVVQPSRAYAAAAAATVGSLIGGMILFLIARRGGEEYLHRYTSHGRGKRLRAWFMEYGLLTVFVPALVPIPLPLKIFILSAGALEVPPLRFLVVFMAARIPRYVLFAWLGVRLGNGTWPYLREHIWELLLFSAALFAVLYLAIRFWHGRRIPRE
jgi:membrane protein YqaA with SNARE-associated domain